MNESSNEKYSSLQKVVKRNIQSLSLESIEGSVSPIAVESTLILSVSIIILCLPCWNQLYLFASQLVGCKASP